MSPWPKSTLINSGDTINSGKHLRQTNSRCLETEFCRASITPFSTHSPSYLHCYHYFRTNWKVTFFTATGMIVTWDVKFLKLYWGTYCDSLYGCLQLSMFFLWPFLWIKHKQTLNNLKSQAILQLRWKWKNLHHF